MQMCYWVRGCRVPEGRLLCVSRFTGSLGRDADISQTIRHHCILDAVPAHCGWRIRHAPHDDWGYQIALDTQLGNWYAYEARLVGTCSLDHAAYYHQPDRAVARQPQRFVSYRSICIRASIQPLSLI
jgi:streptomycin 6-kinase